MSGKQFLWEGRDGAKEEERWKKGAGEKIAAVVIHLNLCGQKLGIQLPVALDVIKVLCQHL